MIREDILDIALDSQQCGVRAEAYSGIISSFVIM